MSTPARSPRTRRHLAAQRTMHIQTSTSPDSSAMKSTMPANVNWPVTPIAARTEDKSPTNNVTTAGAATPVVADPTTTSWRVVRPAVEQWQSPYWQSNKTTARPPSVRRANTFTSPRAARPRRPMTAQRAASFTTRGPSSGDSTSSTSTGGASLQQRLDWVFNALMQQSQQALKRADSIESSSVTSALWGTTSSTPRPRRAASTPTAAAQSRWAGTGISPARWAQLKRAQEQPPHVSHYKPSPPPSASQRSHQQRLQRQRQQYRQYQQLQEVDSESAVATKPGRRKQRGASSNKVFARLFDDAARIAKQRLQRGEEMRKVRRYQPKIPAYLKAREEEEQQQQEGKARASNNTASGLPSSPVRLLSFFDRLQVYDERKRSTMARLAHEAKERDDDERQCTFKPHRFTSERWQLALRQPPPSPRARAELTK